MDYSVMGFMKYVWKKTFNRDIFSYAHFKCKKVSISCLGDTYFLCVPDMAYILEVERYLQPRDVVPKV